MNKNNEHLEKNQGHNDYLLCYRHGLVNIVAVNDILTNRCLLMIIRVEILHK